jgi:hypothetical protein
VSIHPLGQADLGAILAHLAGEPDDDPSLTARPGKQPRQDRTPAARLAAGRSDRRQGGRPGGSAQAEYQHRRARDRTAWAQTLPWRVAAALGAGLAAVVAAALLSAPLPAQAALPVAVVAGVGWRLRFRPSPETLAWQRGAAGERQVARLLAPSSPRVDSAARPSRPHSTANIDHLVIGTPGVFVVDAKHYRGHLHLSHDGGLWHGRYPLAAALSATRWEADKVQATLAVPDIDVVPIVAVCGAPVPFGQVSVHGVPVIAAHRLPRRLPSLPPVLTPERAAWAASQLRGRLRPAA